MSKKKDILRAATELFSRKGFKDTSIDEVAEKTGVAHGTVFYHFKTKEDLLLAILAEFEKELVSAYQRHMEALQLENGLEMLEDAVAFYLQLAASMEERFLLLHRHDAYELAEANASCRKHLESIYNCLVDIFEKPIKSGQGDRSIRKLPARRMAMIIFAMVDGLVRLNTYRLYHADTLYNLLIDACDRMLAAR